MSHFPNSSLYHKLARTRRICEDAMVHPEQTQELNEYIYIIYIYICVCVLYHVYIPSEAEETIARNYASQGDKLRIFCVRLLLNNGQLFNAWNPPDVDLLRLLFPLQSESENVSRQQKVHLSLHSLLLPVGFQLQDNCNSP